MPRRIDIDGGDPQNELEEALRELTQRQRAPQQPEAELERAVQEVAEQQKDTVARRRPATRLWTGKVAWIAFSVVVVGLILGIVLSLRQEPAPEPAKSPEDAVQKFWTCLIQEKYEAATNYWPQLQTRYGSAAQAGAQLRDNLRANPPTTIGEVGPAEAIPDTTQFNVPYKVYMQGGQPRTGYLTVTNTGISTTGYVITGGGI